MVLSIVAFWWIWWIVQPPAPKPIPESTVYNKYNPAGNHLKPTSLAAMQKYIKEHEQPQNVQILKGWNTKQISNYMVAQELVGSKSIVATATMSITLPMTATPTRSRLGQ